MKVKLPVERVKEIINEEITLFIDKKNRELINEGVFDSQSDEFEKWLMERMQTAQSNEVFSELEIILRQYKIFKKMGTVFEDEHFGGSN